MAWLRLQNKHMNKTKTKMCVQLLILANSLSCYTANSLQTGTRASLEPSSVSTICEHHQSRLTYLR